MQGKRMPLRIIARFSVRSDYGRRICQAYGGGSSSPGVDALQCMEVQAQLEVMMGLLI
jgi:hypothetical protein